MSQNVQQLAGSVAGLAISPPWKSPLGTSPGAFVGTCGGRAPYIFQGPDLTKGSDYTGPGSVKTKVICTIGPKTASKEKLGALVDAGMNVVRMNFSHGSYEYHGSVIRNLREYLAESKNICAILLDTKGPEIRSGTLTDGKEVELVTGQDFYLSIDKSVVGDKTKVMVDYTNIVKVVKAGDSILVDDGLIELKVLKVEEKGIQTRVLNGGELGERKGINLPGVAVDLPAVTEKDKSDILWGVEQGVDYIAASFIRKASDIVEIRELLGQKGKGIKIIAKIESQEGLDNFDAILEEADGIMVARGDLGVEIPIEKVFLWQKIMINKSNLIGKPVITATQMLESMIKNPRPTRAEATDVANAVFDGTDCVMLSGETAKGDYPVEAVSIMTKICREAERAIDYHALYSVMRQMIPHTQTVVEAVAASTVRAAMDLKAQLIIALTETGTTAKMISKYRPHAPILCMTANEQTARQCLTHRGLFPLLVGSMIGTDAIISRAMATAKALGMVKKGDLVIVTSGMREGVVGGTNLLKVLTVE